MRAAVEVHATEPEAEEAARAYLAAGGDATGAAVSGFFAGAGASAAVLLGPAALLVGRVGVGVRAFDGRPREPGLGLRRRRAAVAAGLPPPEASRVVTPAALTALFVACRYADGATPAKVVAAGLSTARRAGCERRAAALEVVSRVGAAALAEPPLQSVLLHRAGPPEGGALTADDLRAVAEIDFPAGAAGSGLWQPPWQPEGASPAAEALTVVDRQGGVAVLCYGSAAEQLVLEELELGLPLLGAAPARGTARTPPGTPIRWGSPMYLRLEGREEPAEGQVRLLSGVVGARAQPTLEA